jgi:hypothetical protein
MKTMSNIYVPAQTGKSRVFIIQNRARADHDLLYASHAKLTGVSRTHGEITAVEIPDPDNYDQYLEVDEISGQDSRYTATLIAKFPASIRSLLQYLERCKEPFDIRLQFGDCENPSDPSAFAKGEILEHDRVTSYGTDDFGSLQGDEGAEIRETLSISFKNYYDFVRMSYFAKAATITTAEVKDVFVKQSSRCFGASCACNVVFAVTAKAGGSPGTPPDIVFSIDGGAVWYAHDIDTLLSTEDADGVADVGNYVVVISNSAGSISYTDIEQFYYPDTIGWDPAFTEITTGFVEAPNAIRSTGMKAFIAGDGGYVYSTDAPASGVTVLDAGVATSADLLAIAVYSGSSVVAVGKSGAIVYTNDGESFHASPSSPVGVGVNLTAVAMRSASEWLVGTNAGTMYITYDSGEHWSQVYLPGTTPTAISDIVWQGESVGFVSAVVNSNGRIYRTLDAGKNWMIEPASSAGSMPKVDKFNKLGVCKLDANQVFAVGLADNGTAGSIVVGGDSAG